MVRILLSIIIFCLSALPCMANEKTIVAAADPWPPFVNPADPKEGLSLEIIKAAYETEGYTVEMNYVPWARAINGVKKGKYDIIPTTWMTDERKTFLMFSEPYAVNKIKFIKNQDDPFEFEGIKSLTGKKIGTIRGYGYGDEFMNADNFIREDVTDLMTNIKKLTHSSRRIDLTLDDEIVARVTIGNEKPSLLNQIAFTKNALSSNKLYVTSGLQNPRHQEFIEAFNKGLATIKTNGTYAKIMETYGIK